MKQKKAVAPNNSKFSKFLAYFNVSIIIFLAILALDF